MPPIGMMFAEDTAEAALFLASDRDAETTGAAVPVSALFDQNVDVLLVDR